MNDNAPYSLSINPHNSIFIVGSTASGKSELAMRLAETLDGELICADSQTVRRGLNIGTAKPSAEDRLRIPHHLLDIIDPYERFSVADFQRLARKARADITGRGKIPIIVGGTGLYIDALYYNYSIKPRDMELRQELEVKSVPQLQQIITDNSWEMPSNASNPRHLIGAIMRGGNNPADLQPSKGACIYGIAHDDEVLKSRIATRAEQMFAGGLVQEVQKLVRDFGRPPHRMDAIGYPIMLRYMDGDIDAEETMRLLARGDWQYARKQKAWFARNQNIVWLEQSSAYDYIIHDFLAAEQ